MLVIFSLQPQGFRNKELRPLLTHALGLDDPQSITQAKMSYDLRRLRLGGVSGGSEIQSVTVITLVPLS